MIRLRVVLVLFFGVFAVSLLPAALANADTPDRRSNSPSTTRIYPGAFPCNTTLQACISGSSASDVINISAGTYNNSSLVITRSITLQGAGASSTILAPIGAQRIITIGVNIASGVTISNLRVYGGSLTSGTEGGAGIFVGAGSPLTVMNADILSNTLPATLGESGGGILTSAPITLVNVNLIGNKALFGAGGGLRATSTANIVGGKFERNVAFNTGGAMRVTGALTLTNVTVISNTTTDAGANSNGGGVRADGGLFMAGGLVRANSAGNDGGGIYGSNLSISSTQIISNTGNDGGGVYVTGALAITNTLFDKNVARAGNGGSIYSGNSSVTITLNGMSSVSKTTISNNMAITNGGGIYATGGVHLLGYLTFSHNKALNGEGGAIYTGDKVDDNFPNGVTKLWSFNTAAGHGGAIRALGKVNMCMGPAFQSNSAGGGATADGGAIYADGSIFLCSDPFTPSLLNFARNGGAFYAKGEVFLNGHDVSDNTASQNGGCAYSETSVTFNVADAQRCVAGINGGAAYSPFTVTISASSIAQYSQNRAGNFGGLAQANVIIVRDAIIFSNTAKVGGALVATKTLDISNSSIYSNTAGEAGGALSGLNANAWITHSIFTSNKVTLTNSLGGAIWITGTATISNSMFLSNTAQFGGGIAALTVTLDGAHFQGNTALAKGGGISATNVTVRNSDFFSNTAIQCCLGEGGAIRANTGRVEGSYFEGNTARDEGAAAYFSSTATISTSQFIRNTDSAHDRASALWLGKTATVADSLFDGNSDSKSSDGGGAIDVPNAVSVEIRNSNFNNNRANDGGAIRSFGNTLITGSTFMNNVSLCCGAGGALFLTSATINASTFISNYADCCTGGGAVYASGSLSINGSRFVSNTVEQRMDGGAVYADSLLNVANSHFDSNRVVKAASNNTGDGGAIFVEFTGFNISVIASSWFTRNAATDGGALACRAHCQVADSHFVENTVDKPDTVTFANVGTGGAIQALSDLNVQRSAFLRNRAGRGGGAIWHERSNSFLASGASTINSLFAENSAGNTLGVGFGTAMVITGAQVGSLKFLHNTMVSDSLSSGSALAIYSGTASVLNNIFANQQTAIRREGGSVFENFNLYFAVATPLSGTITSGGTTRTGDPKFFNPAQDDYHLGLGSAALDAGTDVLVVEDFDGQTRPNGGGFDIGFDEWYEGKFKVYLPLVLKQS